MRIVKYKLMKVDDSYYILFPVFEKLNKFLFWRTTRLIYNVVDNDLERWYFDSVVDPAENWIKNSTRELVFDRRGSGFKTIYCIRYEDFREIDEDEAIAIVDKFVEMYNFFAKMCEDNLKLKTIKEVK